MDGSFGRFMMVVVVMMMVLLLVTLHSIIIISGGSISIVISRIGIIGRCMDRLRAVQIIALSTRRYR